MQKNTVWAIVLSSIVLVGFMWIQTTYFPAEEVATSQNSIETVAVENETTVEKTDASTIKSDAIILSAEKDDTATQNLEEKEYTIRTDVVSVTFTNKGGDVIDFELLNHKDNDSYVQMADSINEQNRAFSVAFGNENNSINQEIFNVKVINDPDTSIENDQAIIFYKEYKTKNADGTESSFIFEKRYTFHENEYLFKLDVQIEATDDFSGMNFSNAAYTLRGSPQIGPHWDKSKDRYDSRTFMSYTDGKKKKKTLGDNKTEKYENPFTWTGISNKYFVELIVPTNNSTISHVTYSSAIEQDDYANAQVQVTRNPIDANSSVLDTYYIYVGPLTESTLKTYNLAQNNSWNLANLHLDESLKSSGFLSWLEVFLKWMMEMFYKVIPNWGVSIVLVTVIFRLVMFPLTKKQSEGTVKMQELQPQMKVLQDKYKDNPQKLNAEMGKFYKETGYNPMSGCLPLLIQFPIIIAMYNLFNNYFEFRGAMFIPGWIPDLSLPDLIATLGFSIPFLGDQIHLLPILYVLTQIVSMKFTQTQNTGANASSMKIMMYGMPIFFFFIFYNAPSGLLIYWILSNVLMTGQQVIINGVVHGKEKNNEVVVVPKKEVNLPPSAKKMYKNKTTKKNKKH